MARRTSPLWLLPPDASGLPPDWLACVLPRLLADAATTRRLRLVCTAARAWVDGELRELRLDQPRLQHLSFLKPGGGGEQLSELAACVRAAGARFPRLRAMSLAYIAQDALRGLALAMDACTWPELEELHISNDFCEGYRDVPGVDNAMLCTAVGRLRGLRTLVLALRDDTSLGAAFGGAAGLPLLERLHIHTDAVYASGMGKALAQPGAWANLKVGVVGGLPPASPPTVHAKLFPPRNAPNNRTPQNMRPHTRAGAGPQVVT